LRVIRVDDGPFEQWEPGLVVANGEIGELVVGGDNVSQQYFERPEENRLSKIADGPRLLHRMGDVGYLDANGRVWICGRKSQRVITHTETLFTVACEGVFNQHKSVFRTALVGLGKVGRQKPVICVELEAGVRASDSLRREILELGAADSQTGDIETLLFHPSFPVDIRHNAKIFREKLAVWAEEQLQ
jgi:acyl-CoA synthetase (AMP-forming)/AMP-acid ligase II